MPTLDDISPDANAGYHDIAGAYRSHIQRGTYQPDEELPHQARVAIEFGASLGTVRRAFDLLESEGLVDVIQGHGSRVRRFDRLRLPVDRYTNGSHTEGPFESACSAQGRTGRTELIGVSYREATDAIADILEIKTGEEVVLRQQRMLIDNRVVQIQNAWVPRWVIDEHPDAAVTRAGKLRGGVYQGLIDVGHRPVAATQEVIARMPTPEEKRMFGLREGSPVQDVRRVSRNHRDEAVLFTHCVVSGDHVVLTSSHQL